MIWRDPIVEEVRRIRELLAEEDNYDINRMFERIRRGEAQRKAKMAAAQHETSETPTNCVDATLPLPIAQPPV